MHVGFVRLACFQDMIVLTKVECAYKRNAVAAACAVFSD